MTAPGSPIWSVELHLEHRSGTGTWPGEATAVEKVTFVLVVAGGGPMIHLQSTLPPPAHSAEIVGSHGDVRFRSASGAWVRSGMNLLNEFWHAMGTISHEEIAAHWANLISLFRSDPAGPPSDGDGGGNALVKEFGAADGQDVLERLNVLLTAGSTSFPFQNAGPYSAPLPDDRYQITLHRATRSFPTGIDMLWQSANRHVQITARIRQPASSTALAVIELRLRERASAYRLDATVQDPFGPHSDPRS